MCSASVVSLAGKPSTASAGIVSGKIPLRMLYRPVSKLARDGEHMEAALIQCFSVMPSRAWPRQQPVAQCQGLTRKRGQSAEESLGDMEQGAPTHERINIGRAGGRSAESPHVSIP
jgi:hypothetical protein